MKNDKIVSTNERLSSDLNTDEPEGSWSSPLPVRSHWPPLSIFGLECQWPGTLLSMLTSTVNDAKDCPPGGQSFFFPRLIVSPTHLQKPQPHSLTLPVPVPFHPLKPCSWFPAWWDFLSSLLLNWVFANKSHSAGSGGARVRHDSPSVSLGVILPCQPQGELICMASVTNLAVHSLSGCTRRAGPPTAAARHPISLQFFSLWFLFLLLFTPLIMRLFWEVVASICRRHQSFVTSTHSERKHIF